MLLQNINTKNGDVFVDPIRMIRGNYGKDRGLENKKATFPHEELKIGKMAASLSIRSERSGFFGKGKKSHISPWRTEDT